MGERVERDTIGRYEVERLLGKGAMGAVYLARDPLIEREVALKTIRLDSPSFQGKIVESRERFLREAKLTGRLQHPNIVVVYEFGEDHGTLFLAMEYVGGGSLASRMEREGPFPIGDKLIISAQIADALAHAHERGVLHRDIKPANILMTPEGHAKVSDFGIGKLESGDVNLTSTGQMVGSPAYMSPEHVRGERLDSRTDIFSLGVVMYQLFTGVKPFPAESLTTLVYQILNKSPEDPRLLNAELPAEISPVILKCLAKDREERYAEAGEVADVLRDLLARSEDAFNSTLSKRNRATRSGVMKGLTPPAEPPAPASPVPQPRRASEMEKTQKQPDASDAAGVPLDAGREKRTGTEVNEDAANASIRTVPMRQEPELSAVVAGPPGPAAGTGDSAPELADPSKPGPAEVLPSPAPAAAKSEPAVLELKVRFAGPAPVPVEREKPAPTEPAVEKSRPAGNARARFWSILALAGLACVAVGILLNRAPDEGVGSQQAALGPGLTPSPTRSTEFAAPPGTAAEPAPPETAGAEAVSSPTAVESPVPSPVRTKGKSGKGEAGSPTAVPTPAETATPTAVPTPVPDLRISARLGLKLKIEPDQARVFLDGKYIGIADDWDNRGGGELLMFVLPQTRTFMLRVAHPGYADLNIEVTIGAKDAEETAEVKRALLKGTPAGPTGPEGKIPGIDASTTGKVRFEVKPKEAQILVDGQTVGTAAEWNEKDFDLTGPAVHEVVVRAGENKKTFRVIVSPSTGTALATVKAKL